MASISHDGNGYRRVLFTPPGPVGRAAQASAIAAMTAHEALRVAGLIAPFWKPAGDELAGDWRGDPAAVAIARRVLYGRKVIRLGKVSHKDAAEFTRGLERLLWCRRHRRDLDAETAHWIEGLGDELLAKLAAMGLAAPRSSDVLEPFLAHYVAGRNDAKPATVTVWGHTKRNLVEFFGASRPLREITEGDADEFRLYLIGLKLSDNTVRRRCAIAKQFFRAAARKKLIQANPFADIKGAVQANDARDFFITRAMATKVLEQCPDHEWRLIFALSRYGGLRCPSEHLGLRWAEVDWGKGKFLVHSPKTEHHAGGESRWVPIFLELYPYLRRAYELAAEGAEHVITRRRDGNANLRRRMFKIIERAGLTPWPKLFQNLRSTRETELADQFPIHVVCAWIGNSQAVAKKHYLQVTDDHFATAATACTLAPGGAPAAHSAAQHTPAGARRVQQLAEGGIVKPNDCGPVLEGAALCGAGGNAGMGGKGLEPPPETPVNPTIGTAGGASVGAPAQQTLTLAPALARPRQSSPTATATAGALLVRLNRLASKIPEALCAQIMAAVAAYDARPRDAVAHALARALPNLPDELCARIDAALAAFDGEPREVN